MPDITITLTAGQYAAINAEATGNPFAAPDAQAVIDAVTSIVSQHADDLSTKQRIWVAQELSRRGLVADLEAEGRARLIAAMAEEEEEGN